MIEGYPARGVMHKPWCKVTLLAGLSKRVTMPSVIKWIQASVLWGNWHICPRDKYTMIKVLGNPLDRVTTKCLAYRHLDLY